MLLCLAGLLDDASQNEIRTKLPGLLRQYGLGCTALLLPQHISLKISFATDRIDDLLTYFDQLCLGLHPLQVTLRSLEAVAIEDAGVQSGLLWYRIGEDSRLREIHNQLNRDLPQLLGTRNSSIDGERFRFHSTIAYGQKSYAQYQEICAAAASEFGEMRAWIDRLAVFCCLQDTAAAGHFFTLKISRLAKHNADQPILPLKGVEGMNRPKRIQFWGEDDQDDSLVVEILEGKKTATVAKADEYFKSEGEYDDGGYEVGDVVDVYDLRQRLRCRIRVTEVYPVRFGHIPEKLWKEEACRSAEHFQEAHRRCWPFWDLADDFEMMAMHFELVEIVPDEIGP